MPNPPTLLRQQSQAIQTEVVKRARTQHFQEIVDWLNDHDIPATWNQVQYYLHSSNVRTRLQIIKPVKDPAEKVRTYMEALIEYDMPNYTIGNLRLRGPSWTVVSTALHKDGLIEPMRSYSPVRWHILATKDELRGWMEKKVVDYE